ncbi:MAG TPA: flagellar biosynthesis protein FlhA [Haliangiales bacterium]|nr:flagellar biosynthesis protein FlhA [Haliangiales bacterium]
MATEAANRPLLGDAAGGLLVVGVLALAVVPLPAAALDLLLAASLCLSVLVFLVAVYVERPLEFSAFPSVLLLATLFRLSLNIASTRIILLHGGDGGHAAGKVIQAFGEFAVGGNFVVGAVVFLILVIVNFIVITKGADRISEVAARFTLDSMPGKQMAIDADLGAGLINEKEARERRRAIEHEAEFHGAMDGASKFVRGDAVAGLLIVGINIVGGIIIGVAQAGLSIGDAAHTFSILSIGDGLVSQIPALLISTGSALLVTRDSSGKALAPSLGAQLFSRPRPAGLAAAVLGGLALVPGMPHVAFLALAGATGAIALRARRHAAAAPTRHAGEPARGDKPADGPNAQKAEIESLLPIELLSLDVGLDLLPLVDGARNGELLGRIGSLRKQMALELGFIVPPVHVRDDLRLRPTNYKVLISGAKVAGGEVRMGKLLAIDPAGRAIAALPGDAVKEPTFGLPAKWIVPGDRGRAEAAGATVVDPSAVVATHLTEVVRRHAAELLGRRETQELLDVAAKQNAKVVEELIPHLMSTGDVIKVLRNLLAEGVSIRDARTILETLADHAALVKDPGELTELARQRLGRQITLQHVNEAGELRALVLDPRAEDTFRGRPDAGALTRITAALEEAARRATAEDQPALIVCAPDVRRAVAAVALRHVPGLTILSYREVDPAVPLVTRGVVTTKEPK